jgi:hypothetical protein
VLPNENKERAALELLRIGPEVVVIKSIALRGELRDLAQRVVALANGP